MHAARSASGAGRACCAAAAALALAAALEPSIRADRGPVLRVLVHDASASCGARAAPSAADVAALLDATSGDDLVAVTSFGARPGALETPCAPSELRDAMRAAAARATRPDPHGSSLFASLRAVAKSAAELAARDPGRRLEVLVATDARATDASQAALAETAAALRAANCTSLRVLRVAPQDAGSRVTELRGPGTARAGEPFALEVRGVAADEECVVELRDDAGVVETRRVAGRGAFRLLFSRIERDAGRTAFSARVAGEGRMPASVARVVVSSPGRALVLGTTERPVPGVEGDWRDVRELRADAAGDLAARDLVVLDDVPGAALVEIDAELRSFATRGGGLLLLGGGRSFGAGGWAGRPVESLSPLLARPHDARGAFLYLAIDGSGSMAEAWGDAAGAVTRDAAVRSAARALVRTAAHDTVLVLRQFASDLLPGGSPPVELQLDEDGAERALRAIDAMPAPGGATALLPPLREARLLAGRSGARRAVVVLTDGRTAEGATDLHAALASLDDVRVTFVLPGSAAFGDEAGALRTALAGTKAAVRGAADPGQLADIFRDLEESARVDEPVLSDRRLRRAGSASLVSDDDVPEFAARILRTWAARDARLVVETDRGEPVAAVRRAGLGTVAALATRPGDAAWLAPSDAAERLVRSLAGAAARPASGRFRVERDGASRLLVRHDAEPGAETPAFLETGSPSARTRSPLRPAESGLLAADAPGGARADAEFVDLVAADGRVLASAGLDVSAPDEYRDPPEADLDALAALATLGGPRPGMPLAPWLAGAAVVLALASVAVARVKSERLPAR